MLFVLCLAPLGVAFYLRYLVRLQKEAENRKADKMTFTVENAKTLRQVEFSEASEMERFFIEGRIKLVYYLYAFVLAIGGFSLTLFNDKWSSLIYSHPDWFLLLGSIVCGLLGLLSFLALATIRNWNGALERYGTWKQWLLSAEYGDHTQETRRALFEPKHRLFAGNPGGLTEVPAAVVLAVSIIAQVVIAWMGFRWEGLAPFTAPFLAVVPGLLVGFILLVAFIQRFDMIYLFREAKY
jgi:hypothetical protein